jgi:serine O-acetyltransferase
MHHTTIGAKGVGDDLGVPTIGDHVYVGANAVVIGTIHVGDGAVIGAGSVVLRDVPPGSVVAGNPARIIRELPAAAADPRERPMPTAT